LRVFTGFIVAVALLTIPGIGHAASTFNGTYVNNGQVEVIVTPLESPCWKPLSDKPTTLEPGGHVVIAVDYRGYNNKNCDKDTTNYDVRIKPKGGVEYSGGIYHFNKGGSQCQLVGVDLYTNPPFPTISCDSGYKTYFYTWTMFSSSSEPTTYSFDACWLKSQTKSCPMP